jgi:uncharacterized protein
MLAADYRPCLLLRNGHLQTFLASSGLRAGGANPMRQSAQDVIIETSEGIRLLGSHSSHSSTPCEEVDFKIPLTPFFKGGKRKEWGRSTSLTRGWRSSPRPGSKGLVILLHGWEGSIDSTYMLCTGRALYRSGYDVFRLNFRDHGRSHHLNQGIFYAVLVQEVFEAVAKAAILAKERPVFLVGFSLGGNFALRIALRCGQTPITKLKHVVAISPALDPEEATNRADGHPLIRRYFMKKWRRSLAVKQALFPGLYDFGPILRLNTVQAMTEALLKRYSSYDSAREYFRAYTLTGDALSALPLPTTLLTAEDDPIISAADFRRLRLPSSACLVISRHGGHNGFLEGMGLRSRYERELPVLFDRLIAGPSG